ncbi:2-dehydro-3-deoxygalactonokinase [Massilia sp. W12]|uniref:2-dehydro-3-deoxygalactonokinase n=1 Tax=Massilia sp. W12 TaxID=3126507 RepID=UPI0030D123F0
MNPGYTPVIGIDWGKRNRRAWLLDKHGQMLGQHLDDKGDLSRESEFEEALLELMDMWALRHADVLISGMAGSREGWLETPYLRAGQDLSMLGQGLCEVKLKRRELAQTRCRIVPGVCYTDESGLPDVMRGEETLLYGAALQGAGHGWVVLPGWHSKWVRLEYGAVRELESYMTGELYDLLGRQGSLASLTIMRQHDQGRFEAGLRRAGSEAAALTHEIFTCRALVVTDHMPALHAASYLSGLLIGAELHDMQRRMGAGKHPPAVHIIADMHLAQRYAQALDFFGIRHQHWDPEQLYLSALRALAGLPPGQDKAAA